VPVPSAGVAQRYSQHRRWCQLRAQGFNGLSVVERRRPMKRVICLVAALMLFAASAAAQAPAAGQKLGLASSMPRAYNTPKGNLTQAAEKMPEANYTFKPASDPDLRTYGQWIGHQTDNQFLNCAIIKGLPNPSPPQSNEKKTRKAELVKALADAFAFCDGAFSALTDQSAMQMVKQG